MKHRLAALAAILVVSACAQASDRADHNVGAATTAPTATAQSQAPSIEGPPTENGVYIAHGVCFGEGGCPWVHWRAFQPVQVHERIGAASPIIATIAPGEWVQPIEGQLRLVPRRGVVRTAHHALAVSDGARTIEPLLEVGDVVYLLEPQGEGEFVIWRRGETHFWRWPDRVEEESFIAWEPAAPEGPTLGWWVRVKRANGQNGWVQDPRFECMGPLAGDENCRG